MTISGIVVATLLVLSFFTDLKNQRIPNRVTMSYLVIGLVVQSIAAGYEGFVTAVAGAISGFLPLFLLYLMKGIGAGDVKLFAAIGAWLGASMTLQLMMYSILFAGLIGVFILISRLYRRTYSKNGHSFPFMLAVAPASITLFMFIID